MEDPWIDSIRCYQIFSPVTLVMYDKSMSLSIQNYHYYYYYSHNYNIIIHIQHSLNAQEKQLFDHVVYLLIEPHESVLNMETYIIYVS